RVCQGVARSTPGRLDLRRVAGTLGGGSDERPDAEVLHVLLGEPAVVLAELCRGVLTAVHARDEGAARVVVLPLGEVVDLAADDDPAVVERRVLCELLARDGPVAAPGLRRLPEVGGDLPAGGLERLVPRAEVPWPELPDRQLVADRARVERVDPRVVAARTLRVIEDGVVPLVDRSQDLPALRRVLRLEVLEEELRRELETRRAVVAHALVVQQR